MKPLITASNEGHVRMVKLLLDKGADVNLSDQVGMLLCFSIYYTCFNLVLHGQNVCDTRQTSLQLV